MRRRLLAATVALAIPALVGFTWPGTVEWLCTRGIKHYEAGQFDEAGESFERALEADPGNVTLEYNRGTALHRRGLQDEASEAFDVAAEAGDGHLARDAAYNRGNARLSAADYAGAAESYKNALRLDPTDTEARHNLELALRAQQRRQQDQDDRRRDDPRQDDAQQDEGQPEDAEQDDGAEQPQPDDQRDDDRQDPRDASSAAAQGEDGELTEEQARRLLHALTSEDAEMQQVIRRSPQRHQPAEGEKDW